MVRVFTNDPGEQGSIPGRVVPRTKKIVRSFSLFNTQDYKAGIKGKWSNQGKRVASFPTPH